jgi:hypothetical protein
MCTTSITTAATTTTTTTATTTTATTTTTAEVLYRKKVKEKIKQIKSSFLEKICLNRKYRNLKLQRT